LRVRAAEISEDIEDLIAEARAEVPTDSAAKATGSTAARPDSATPEAPKAAPRRKRTTGRRRNA
jgi:hypothetical protein